MALKLAHTEPATGQHPSVNALAKGRLGAVAINASMLSAAAPFMVAAGVIPLIYGVSGVTAIPAAFVVVAVVLALFSVGYLRMSREIVNAGAFYAYVSHGLGRVFGVPTALVALVSYNALQVALYPAFGVAAAPMVESLTGRQLPWWLIAIGLWLPVAVLGVRRVNLSGRLLALLMAAEIGVVVIYDLAFVTQPADGLPLTTLNPAGLLVAGTSVVAVTAVLGFVGFEQAAVYAEEARDPIRTIPRATTGFLVVTVVLYAGTGWATSVATGLDQLVARAAEEQDRLLFTLAAERLGQTAADVGAALFVTSIAAAAISFHNATARYGYALGREHVIPSAFGSTSRRAGTPKVASLVQSAAGLVSLVGFALIGGDPMVHGFLWGGTLGGFGCLALYTIASYAIAAYLHDKQLGTRVTRTCAYVAAVLLTITLFLGLLHLDVLLGVSPNHAVRFAIPALFLAVFAGGYLWARILRRYRPDIYQRIGLGPAAITGNPTF